MRSLIDRDLSSAACMLAMAMGNNIIPAMQAINGMHAPPTPADRWRMHPIPVPCIHGNGSIGSEACSPPHTWLRPSLRSSSISARSSLHRQAFRSIDHHIAILSILLVIALARSFSVQCLSLFLDLSLAPSLHCSSKSSRGRCSAQCTEEVSRSIDPSIVHPSKLSRK